jgi:exonuclease SbcC
LIPLKLTVKNFMCYRDDVPTLDFEGIHVACLCGDNGHGKTALLDSITWTLWGQARARTQEELVHQGRQDMAVVLEFMARDQRYRVSRRYSRSGRSKGATILELQVSSGSGFRPITGNSVRETEARIREILHLDYETFVNTAFLLQGNADRFTTSKPTRRKEVLAEVLDLSYYTTLEERAKERSRSSQDGILAAGSAIELRRQEISRRPGHEEGLASVKVALQGLGARLDSRRGQAASIQDRLNTLQARGVELEALDQRLLERQGEVAELKRRVRDHEVRVGGHEAVAAREPEIRERSARLDEVRTGLDRLDRAAFAASGIERERSRLREAIAVQQERLLSRAKQLRQVIESELEPKAKRLPEIEAAHVELTADQATLDELEATAGRAREEAGKMATELERLGLALDTKTELDGRKAGLEREIAVQGERLSAQADQLRDRISHELQPRVRRLLAIEDELRLLALGEERLVELAGTISEHRRESEEIDGELRYLRQAREDLLVGMEDMRKKFDILDQDGAECPVCKQPLGSEGKEHLRSECEAEGRAQRVSYDENAEEQRALGIKHKEAVDLVARLETERDTRQREAQGAAATLQRDLKDSQEAQREMQPAAARLREIESGITEWSFAMDKRAELARLDAELAELDYDPERRAAVQAGVRETNERLSRLETELGEGRRDVQSRAIALGQELDSARKAGAELGPRRAELDRVEAVIGAQDFARDERDRLLEVKKELGALGYDPDAHRESQQEAKELEPYGDLNRKLLEALDALPSEREALASSQQALERGHREAASDEARRLELAGELETLPALESDMAEEQRAREALETQERDARAQEKYLEVELDRLAVLEQEVRRQEKERRGLEEQKGIYDELAVAFGKNGIQALIIETAIPQLQDDANELLGRLTENRMFLKLQLQEGRRERRMGLPSEELDIKISDEVGTRSYESFSGGEKFRINFALRIALSKLLARRSGAPLPILFIDEGFGTQDATGQERLKEAIQSIQADFQKIIVITHVEQVKESFPNRIEVTRTPEGSTFVVV